MHRLVIRAREALSRARPTSYLWVYGPSVAVVAVVILLVLLVLIAAADSHADQQTTGLWPIVQDQAVSVLSLGLVAGLAYAWYQLNHLQARRTYLVRCADMADVSLADAESLAPLATTIVGQLRDVRPPRSSLVVTDDADVSGALLAQVTRTIALARHRTVRRLLPVTVDVSGVGTETHVPTLVQETFVRLFTDASADRPRAERLLRRAVRRHRVVALLSGLDRVAEERSELFRRRVIAGLIRSCLEEKLPFVSSVPAELITPMGDVAVLRELPATIAGQAETLAKRVAAQVPIDQQALISSTLTHLKDTAPLSRWQARLVADVIVMQHRSGAPVRDALRLALQERDPDLRELGWMDRLTEDAMQTDIGASLSRALDVVGLAAHYRQEMSVPEEALRAQPAPELNVGLWRLARRGVLVLSPDEGAGHKRTIRFTRPEWFSFAGARAMGLDPEHWRWLLWPEASQATLAALTMATARMSPPSARSPVSLLAVLRDGRTDDLTLEMLTAATRGLRRHGTMELGATDLQVLARAWRVSSQQARLAFIDALEPDPGLAAFCWRCALPSGGAYAVRRAASRRLASMGKPAWLELREQWSEIVSMAETADLRDTSRSSSADSTWVVVARPFATLGWTLPSLFMVLDPPESEEALALLRRMCARVRRPEGTADGAPDAGLEISLAEGMKLAAGVMPRSGSHAESLLQEGRALFQAARSWSSKLVLLQAVGLMGNSAITHVDLDGVAASQSEHPFVREAARLTARNRAGPVGQDIWLDDVQSLQDGGLELSDEAHRLLGLSTLLINLAERQARARDEPPTVDGIRRRTVALTAKELPRCFVRSAHTATMFHAPCDCPFRLCGPNVTGTIGDRRFSAAFAQRAEVTAASQPLSPGGPFVTRAFAHVWRLSQVLMEVEEQPVSP